MGRKDLDRRLRLAGINLMKIVVCAGFVLGCAAIVAYVIKNSITNTQGRDFATLIPTNYPMPEHSCNKIAGSKFRIYFGDYLVVVDGFPNRVISMANEDMLVIDKTITGHITITSLTVFDGDLLIAKADKNNWQIESFKRTEDRSTLIVYDHLGDEALNISFFNRDAIRLSGIFQHPKSQTKIGTRIDSELNLPGTQPRSNCFAGNSKYAADFSFP
jgi:hypothetical protein